MTALHHGLTWIQPASSQSHQRPLLWRLPVCYPRTIQRQGLGVTNSAWEFQGDTSCRICRGQVSLLVQSERSYRIPKEESPLVLKEFQVSGKVADSPLFQLVLCLLPLTDSLWNP